MKSGDGAKGGPPPEHGDPGLEKFFGRCWGSFLVLGVVAAVRRDIPTTGGDPRLRDRLGAGAQVVTSGPLLLLDGPPSELLRTATMPLGRLVHAVIIRGDMGRVRAPRARSTAAAATSSIGRGDLRR